MHYFYDALVKELFYNPNFRLDQNDIVLNTYNILSGSYKNNDNEIKMVEKLCSCLHNKKCGKAKLYAVKVHGNRSKAEFYNATNKLVKKELADMVVISLVTFKNQIILEKIAFIQNKKENSKDIKKWSIDQDQLFLLNNFPTFNGVSGIFGKQKNIALPNIFGQLGCYGLFHSDGDMVFANTKIINALQNTNVISLNNLRNESAKNNTLYNTDLLFTPECREDIFYFLKYNLMYPNLIKLPILGNCELALNLYQFIRNWTQLNIGETTIVRGKVINSILSGLADYFMKGSGISNFIKYLKIENEETYDWNSDFDGAVFVLHHNIED